MTMKIEVTLNIQWPASPPAWLIPYLAAITRIDTTMTALSDAVAALTAEVTAETTVEQSAIALLNGIPALITNAINAANGDAAAAVTNVQAAVDSITASSGALASAVTANTPPAS